jgi:trimeric autotransporter adhesin
MAATTLHGVAPILTSLRGKVPGPSSSSSSRRVAAAVARLGRTRAHTGSIVSLRPRPLVHGRVALGFTAPRAIASDKIPKSAENEADTAVEPSVVEKTSPGGSNDAPGKPTPPKSSAVIDVESLTSTASTETTPEPESDGGDGGEGSGNSGSGGGGDGDDHSSSDGSGGKAPGPELPESMVALASWAVSQTKDWSAAADGGLRAAFGTLVGVNCVTVMLIRSMRSRSEKKRLVKDDAKRAAAEAKNIARHEEELAAMSKKREMAQVSASAGGSAIAAAATGASAARSSAPAFPPRERDTWDGDNEVLNSTGAGVGFATNNPVASVAATDPVEAIDASPGGVSFPKSDVDADEADDFLVRALESYDAADALIGGPSGADIAVVPTNDNTAVREDMLAFAVIPDDARDPRVVAALGDAARAQAAAAGAMAAAAAATKRAAEATDAAQRLQRAIAAGATEAELAALAAATSLAADRAVEEGSRAGYAVTSGAGTVDRALNVAGEGIGRVAGAVARGVSVATPAVVDGARRYVPAGLDAVSRGVTTVWDGSVSSEGIRAPGLKQRALAFLNKVKQHQRGSAGAKAGVSSAEGSDGKDDVAAGAAV